MKCNKTNKIAVKWVFLSRIRPWLSLLARVWSGRGDIIFEFSSFVLRMECGNEISMWDDIEITSIHKEIDSEIVMNKS